MLRKNVLNSKSEYNHSEIARLSLNPKKTKNPGWNKSQKSTTATGWNEKGKKK